MGRLLIPSNPDNRNKNNEEGDINEIRSLSRLYWRYNVRQLYSLCGPRTLASGVRSGQCGIQCDGCQRKDVYHQLHGKSGPERYLPELGFSDPGRG
uniref:C.aethiops open reading frame A protein n=1 Tax=Chlorocebus aethiops TaxID=9534 RepID=V9GZF0_CHLAE|nr:403 is the position of the first start codon in open reading frame C [Chlorocebus aethiops]